VHITSNTDDPLNLATTTPGLFFTRWITHYCAPIFVFLSGTSIYLQSRRKTTNELSSFLIKRGCWLIFAEWTMVAFAWTFNPFFNVIPFQVIWAIGSSMVVLGLLIKIKIPYKALLVLGLVIVLGHNLLDFPERAANFKAGFWWNLLHHGAFVFYEYAPNHFAILVYAFPVWTGLMILGYCAGIFFTPKYSSNQRITILKQMGIVLLMFFVVLRFINLYGDPVGWTKQSTGFNTFLSFINVNKYPPSLLYMSITIGVAMLLLAYFEKINNQFTKIMVVFGRTAFFYYLLHLYLIHLIQTILFFAKGHSMDDAVKLGKNMPFLFVVPGEGYGLPVVYLIWLLVLLILYPFCKKYDQYKTAHKEKWWLSYL
jgi:uncharacterized membrane protein